jgi:hypothetical protein
MLQKPTVAAAISAALRLQDGLSALLGGIVTGLRELNARLHGASSHNHVRITSLIA